MLQKIASRKWSENVYFVLAYRIFLLFPIYLVCRLSFYFFNSSFFPNMDMERFSTILLGGLRFDLTAILYLNGFYIVLISLPFNFQFKAWYKSSLKYLYLIFNSIGIALNIIDITYYRFTLRRTTITVFQQFENEQNFWSLLPQFFIDYWYTFLLFLILVWLLVKCYKLFNVNTRQTASNPRFYLGGVAMFVIVITLCVGGTRGGFAHSTRPITISNAAKYATVPQDVNIVLNTPFSMFRTINARVIKKKEYFKSESTLEREFNPKVGQKADENFRYNNVVIFILESFSKEFVGAYHKNTSLLNYKGYTPFLDSLIKKSLVFEHPFSNGRKSIDAMPSVLCGLPSTSVPFVLSHYSNNKVNSIASLLKPKGYYTSFFHGAPNGSMGFDAFAKHAGFDAYFGKTEYNNDDDFDGLWGIWDDKFIDYFAEELGKHKQPFFSTLFTTSSHHPYKLPEQFEGKYDEGTMRIHKTIGYTDDALRQFFTKAKQSEWYDSTLFVFCADHASAEIGYSEYRNPRGYFEIPVFFFHPSYPINRKSDDIVQQMDIMPTVLSFLNYDSTYLTFGKNALDSNYVGFAFNYSNGLYQAFEGDFLLQFNGKEFVGLYKFKTDLLLKYNLIKDPNYKAKKLKRKLKAIIQQYNNRMVDNNLTY